MIEYLQYLDYAVAGAVGLVLLLNLWMLVVVVKIKTRVQGIASTRPVESTDKMVKYWTKQMNRYEPGTPKHNAYRQRLIEAGKLGR